MSQNFVKELYLQLNFNTCFKYDIVHHKCAPYLGQSQSTKMLNRTVPLSKALFSTKWERHFPLHKEKNKPKYH
jgi:hypothetical protein